MDTKIIARLMIVSVFTIPAHGMQQRVSSAASELRTQAKAHPYLASAGVVGTALGIAGGVKYLWSKKKSTAKDPVNEDFLSAPMPTTSVAASLTSLPDKPASHAVPVSTQAESKRSAAAAQIQNGAQSGQSNMGPTGTLRSKSSISSEPVSPISAIVERGQSVGANLHVDVDVETKQAADSASPATRPTTLSTARAAELSKIRLQPPHQQAKDNAIAQRFFANLGNAPAQAGAAGNSDVANAVEALAERVQVLEEGPAAQLSKDLMEMIKPLSEACAQAFLARNMKFTSLERFAEFQQDAVQREFRELYKRLAKLEGKFRQPLSPELVRHSTAAEPNCINGQSNGLALSPQPSSNGQSNGLSLDVNLANGDSGTPEDELKNIAQAKESLSALTSADLDVEILRTRHDTDNLAMRVKEHQQGARLARITELFLTTMQKVMGELDQVKKDQVKLAEAVGQVQAVDKDTAAMINKAVLQGGANKAELESIQDRLCRGTLPRRLARVEAETAKIPQLEDGIATAVGVMERMADGDNKAGAPVRAPVSGNGIGLAPVQESADEPDSTPRQIPAAPVIDPAASAPIAAPADQASAPQANSHEQVASTLD